MTTRLTRAIERGSVTVFVSIAAVGLLAMIGLIVDGGTKVRALQQADRVAAEAARAAGQAIDVPAAIVGDQPTVQPAAAAAAAAAFLDSAGVNGSVSVLDGGRRIAVATTVHADTVFLGLIGIDHVNATGRAEAQLVRGVTGAEP